MSKKRIELLDAARGLALFAMIFYHLVYDMGMFGLVSWSFVFSLPMDILERICASTFILASGFSSRLSRDNLRRGALVTACGLTVELAASVVGVTIRFGVLLLLGCSMMLYGLCGDFFRKLPRPVLPMVSIPAFCLGYYVYRYVYIGAGWLYPLGLRNTAFVSEDYFPLFPWFFLFLLGSWLGGELLRNGHRPWMDWHCPRLLTLPGRHTLLVYMLHQPILYGLVWMAANCR